MQGDEINNEVPVSVETPTSPQPETSLSPATETSNSPAEVSAETSGEQSKETLLDAVLKAVEPANQTDAEKKSADEEAPASQAESEVKAEDAQEDADDASDDDEQAPPELPASARKRINKLARQRRELREEVAALRAPAEIGQQLQQYAEANRLSSQDVVFALDLASMVSRGDYKAFYETISPLVRHAQEVTGVVLPQDLQQMVDQGHMSPQAAREFANTRFERANYEIQAREMQQHQQVQAVSRVKDDVQRSVSVFEQRLMASDPDYKAKAETVRRTAQAMLFERGGKIGSVEEAIAITQQAYDEVNRQFRRMQPTLRPTAPTPGVSNPQTPAARTAPKSLMEAAMQGLERSRRAG